MQLQRVFDVIILARALYASPASQGYLSAANTDTLQFATVIYKSKAMANCHRQV